MRFLSAPEYPLFPGAGEPFEMYEAVVRATGVTRAAVASLRPHVVVHDILTLAPAMAGELEGVPVATLIPHLYPAGAPGFPPYALGARLPRTGLGRRLWGSLERPLEAGLRRGADGPELRAVSLGTAAGVATPRRAERAAVHRRNVPSARVPTVVAGRRARGRAPDVGAAVRRGRAACWERPAGAGGALDRPGPVAPAAAGRVGRAGRRIRSACSRPGIGGRWIRRSRCPQTPGWSNGSRTRRTMPACSLVICHAGHGTMARALACGCPILAVPHVGDMAENAARADWAGVGVRLPWRLLGAGFVAACGPTLLVRAVAHGAGSRAGRVGGGSRRSIACGRPG